MVQFESFAEDKPAQQILDEGKVGEEDIPVDVEPSQDFVSSFDLHLTQSQSESESQEIIEPTKHVTCGHHVESFGGSSTGTSKAAPEGEMPCEPLHFGGDADIQVESLEASEQEVVIKKSVCESEMENEEDMQALEVQNLPSDQHRKENEGLEEQILPVPQGNSANVKKSCKDLSAEEKTLVKDESQHPEVIVISPLSSVPSIPSQSILAPLASAAAGRDQGQKQPTSAPLTGNTVVNLF